MKQDLTNAEFDELDALYAACFARHPALPVLEVDALGFDFATSDEAIDALLARWPDTPKVDLVTTDGFLYPNAGLEREGLMEKKGFPESYDLPSILRFMSDIKAGTPAVKAPVYSHLTAALAAITP